MKHLKLMLALASSILLVGRLGAEPLNLVKNGDFEDMEENWEIVHPAAGKVSFEKEGGQVGACLVRMSPTNSASPDFLVLQQNIAEPKPGLYIMRARFRISPDYAGKMPLLSVNVLKQGGGYNSFTTVGPRKSAQAGVWLVEEKEVEIPAGTPRVYFQLFVYGSSGYVDFDGIEMTPKPAAAPAAAQ